MRKIDWNSVEEFTTDFEKVPAGGYTAIITKVEDEPSKEYLKIEMDIADGPFNSYYTKLAEAKGFWGLTMYRSYKDTALGFFKNFKSCVEGSNRNYVFDNDEKTLEGRMLGIVLAEEEYIANDGSEKTRLYVAYTKTVDEIRQGKYKVPELKKLKQSKDVPSSAFEPTSIDSMDTPF